MYITELKFKSLDIPLSVQNNFLMGNAFETASNQAHATTWSCKSSGPSTAVVGSSEQQLQNTPSTTTTTSTISTADLSFLHPSVRLLSSLTDNIQQNQDTKQLTHISATSDVTLPSLFEMVSQDQSTNNSRLERMGRATLRKAQAIEDEDHLTTVTCPNTTIDTVFNPLTVPSHNLPNDKRSSYDEEDAFKQTNNHLSINSTSHFPAQPLPASVALALNNSTINPAIQLIMQQRQINKDTFQSPDKVLTNWSKSSDLFTNQLLNLTHGFNFPNLVHPVDIPSNTDDIRAAAVAAANSVVSNNHNIPDRKPHSFDMAKFADTRNVHSTESTASTSSEPCFKSSDVPRKSVIQDDIRMNKGRFTLVKKRGRSDVWNLFGQVLDNVTGQRLPYVACYACKVLYTDTGGGTGNMTRHRCPLGASYRNIGSSSTDTINDSFNAQSSFESYHGNSPDNGKESPVTLPTSSSKSFDTSSTTTQNVSSNITNNSKSTSRMLPTQTSNLSSTSSITLQASSSSTESAPPGLLSCSLSVDTPSTPSGPPILIPSIGSMQSNQTLNIELEKENMLRNIANYCISSFELPNIINKPSFVKLLYDTFICSQRIYSTNNSLNIDFKSFSKLLPTESTLSQFIKHRSNLVRDKLRTFFQSAHDNGIMLICQGLKLGERQMMTIWTSFISDNWNYERICIAVKENETDLKKILIQVAENYGFINAKQIYVTLDDSISPDNRPKLPENMKYIENIVQAINQIVASSINESSNISEIIKITKIYEKILNYIKDTGITTEFHYFNDDNNQIINVMELYRLLKQVRTQYDIIKQYIIDNKMDDILNEIQSINKNIPHILENLLEPFHEVAETLNSHDIPHFHTILPEWHALMHECAPSDDDNEMKPVSLSERPRRRSLRHQKSIEDEPHLQIVNDDSNPPPTCDNNDKWTKTLRQTLEKKLKNWAKENINSIHMIATALNPLMRKLQIICTDSERLMTYSKIRQNAGLKKTSSFNDHTEDYEPQRKRQNFLNKIEDQGMVQDELDNYLNIQLTRQDKRNVLEFWSKINNLPKLSQYAKSVLSIIAAASPLQLKYVTNNSLDDIAFSDMLVLKTSSNFIDTQNSTD